MDCCLKTLFVNCFNFCDDIVIVAAALNGADIVVNVFNGASRYTETVTLAGTWTLADYEENLNPGQKYFVTFTTSAGVRITHTVGLIEYDCFAFRTDISGI